MNTIYRIDAEIKGENGRKAFINNNVNATGPNGFGFRSMKPDEIKAIKRAATDQAIAVQITEENQVRATIEQEAMEYAMGENH